MVELFANSLVDGFWVSSAMGKGLVLVQLVASVVMFTFVFGKWRELGGQLQAARRVTRDVMGAPDVLGHYLQRKDNGHTALENIYWRTCDRLLKLLAPDVRSLLVGRQPGVAAALTAHEMGLVKTLCEHVLDEEALRMERGMGMIATIVATAPMLGLLGTVWGVLDAFADMGAAGSATIATMAPAIASALVTTVVGLLVAIPGVMCHNVLSARLRDLLSGMEGFADDLMGRIALEFQDPGRGA